MKTALEIVNESYEKIASTREKSAVEIVNEAYEKQASLASTVKGIGAKATGAVKGSKLVSGAKGVIDSQKKINHVTALKDRMKAKGRIDAESLSQMKSVIGDAKNMKAQSMNTFKEGAKDLGGKAGLVGAGALAGGVMAKGKKQEKTALEIVSEAFEKIK